MLTGLSSDFIQKPIKHWSPKGSFLGECPKLVRSQAFQSIQLPVPPSAVIALWPSSKHWGLRGDFWIIKRLSMTGHLWDPSPLPFSVCGGYYSHKSRYIYFRNISSSPSPSCQQKLSSNTWAFQLWLYGNQRKWLNGVILTVEFAEILELVANAPGEERCGLARLYETLSSPLIWEVACWPVQFLLCMICSCYHCSLTGLVQNTFFFFFLYNRQ